MSWGYHPSPHGWEWATVSKTERAILSKACIEVGSFMGIINREIGPQGPAAGLYTLEQFK